MNKFDELIKKLKNLLLEDTEDEYGETFLINEKVIIKLFKVLELGKLYKEYFDYVDAQFKDDDVYNGLVYKFKKEIKELDNEQY